MNWLVGYTLASIASAFIVIKIFDYIFEGVTSGLVSGARAILFVGTWTAVTARMGMRSFTKRIRQLRQDYNKHTLFRVWRYKDKRP